MNEEHEQILEILCDFGNAIEVAVVNMKRQIAELVGVNVEKWNPEKIKWSPAEGSHVQYNFGNTFCP